MIIVRGIILKKIKNKFILVVTLCLSALSVQASSVNSPRNIESVVCSSFLTSDINDKNVRQADKWKVVYEGNDTSDMIFDDDVEGFEGTDEEYDLFLEALINKRRRDFVFKRNSLLTQASRLLEESIGNFSHTEQVVVKIHQLGDEDYTINLNYIYHAYDSELGSFEDETSSRSQDASSSEQVMSVIRRFVVKHCNELVPRLVEPKAQADSSRSEQSLSQQSIKRESPVRKKHRPDLKQLTLMESIGRSSMGQKTILK